MRAKIAVLKTEHYPEIAKEWLPEGAGKDFVPGHEWVCVVKSPPCITAHFMELGIKNPA